jgi:hypothetical protein
MPRAKRISRSAKPRRALGAVPSEAELIGRLKAKLNVGAVLTPAEIKLLRTAGVKLPIEYLFLDQNTLGQIRWWANHEGRTVSLVGETYSKNFDDDERWVIWTPGDSYGVVGLHSNPFEEPDSQGGYVVFE